MNVIASPPVRVSLVLVFLLGGVLGCASTEEGSSSGDSSPDRLVFSDLDASVSGRTAYDVIEEHRPQWLRRRGRTSINNPAEVNIYLEGTKYGTVESLRDISAENVELAEHLDSGEAQFRFGPGNTQGAIVVYLRSR